MEEQFLQTPFTKVIQWRTSFINQILLMLCRKSDKELQVNCLIFLGRKDFANHAILKDNEKILCLTSDAMQTK